ncbi:Protein Y51H4A.13 [Aphelenchoides avenae]|nr:Protein Y51H4A.13 [Aphelenchus avenae]
MNPRNTPGWTPKGTGCFTEDELSSDDESVQKADSQCLLRSEAKASVSSSTSSSANFLGVIDELSELSIAAHVRRNSLGESSIRTEQSSASSNASSLHSHTEEAGMYRPRGEYSTSPPQRPLTLGQPKPRTTGFGTEDRLTDGELSVIGDDIELKFSERVGRRLLRPIYINAVEVGFAYTESDDTSRKLSIRGVTIALWYFISRGHQALALLPFCFKTFPEKSDNWKELMELYHMNLVEFTHGAGSDKYVEVNRVAAKRAQLYGGCIVARSQMHNLVQDNPTLDRTVESRLLMPTFTSQDIIFPADGPLGRRGATFLDTIQCGPEEQDEYARCVTQQMSLKDQRIWVQKLAALVPSNVRWRDMAELIGGGSSVRTHDNRLDAMRRRRDMFQPDPYQDKIHPPETTPADHRGFSRFKTSRYSYSYFTSGQSATRTHYPRRPSRRHSFDEQDHGRPVQSDRFSDNNSNYRSRHYSNGSRSRRRSIGYADAARYGRTAAGGPHARRVSSRGTVLDDENLFVPSYRRPVRRRASQSPMPASDLNAMPYGSSSGAQRMQERVAEISAVRETVESVVRPHLDRMLRTSERQSGPMMPQLIDRLAQQSISTSYHALDVTSSPQFCQLRDIFGFEKAKLVCEKHPNQNNVNLLVELALSLDTGAEQVRGEQPRPGPSGATNVLQPLRVEVVARGIRQVHFALCKF